MYGRVLGAWILATALAGAALAVGTVHTITLCIVTGAVAAAAVLTWWNAEPMRARSAATLLVLIATALTVYTALQTVPMPLSWLAIVAPHNADVWGRALAPLHENGPRWAPSTLDPTSTRVQVLRGVCYLLALVTALRIARRKDGSALLCGGLVITGVVLAAAAVLHPAFGAHRLFGVYEPGGIIGERHIAPLLNPNNLAGYVNVAFCIALADMLAPEPRVPRAVSAAVGLFLAAVQVWIASRAGVITMGLGTVMVVSIMRVARGQRRRAVASLSLVAGLASLAGAAMIALGGSDEASQELLNADSSKLSMFGHIMRMQGSVLWLGTGRGAFESAYPAFRDLGGGHVTYAYPENVIAQWTIEWGVVVALAGLVVIAVALRPSEMLARSTAAAGAWSALVAVAVQNLADLGTEVPGLMLACVTCAAIVTAGSPGRELRGGAARWSEKPRWVALAAGAASIVAIAWAAATIGIDLHDDRRSLHDAAMDDATTPRAMHELARAAMLRHPGEPYLPFAVAIRAHRRRDDPSLPWLGATLERAAVYGPAHLLLARAVAARSPSQARTEYRLFTEQTPDLASVGMQESAGLVSSFNDAMELVPDGKIGLTVLDSLATTLAARLPSTRARLDAELLARAPTDAAALARITRDTVEDLEGGQAASWCAEGYARAECLRIAEDQVARERHAEPELCDSYALEARTRIAAGENARAALQALEKAADTARDRAVCLEQLTEIAQHANEPGIAEAALDKVVSAGCAEDEECARNLTWAATNEQLRGNFAKALALYKAAHERTPGDDVLLEACAWVAARAGLHAEAAEDYERLAKRRPAEERFKKSAAAERDAALRSAVKL